MIAWSLLAAADIDYLKLIGVIVAFAIMAINRLLTGLKNSRSQAPPPDATPPHDPAAASMRPDLNAEVKEFLRRAAQQKAGQRGSQQSSRSLGSISPGAGRRDDDQRKGEQRRRKRPSQPAKPVEPVVPKLEDSLANRRVTSRLETSSLDERAEQLSTLDKQHDLEGRMPPMIAHPIGQLTPGLLGSTQSDPASDSTVETAAPQADFAGDIAAALRSPQSIRTAVILNEILARPTDRW